MERGANDLRMVQVRSMPSHHLVIHKNPEWFTFLVQIYPGCLGKKAIKGM